MVVAVISGYFWAEEEDEVVMEELVEVGEGPDVVLKDGRRASVMRVDRPRSPKM